MAKLAMVADHPQVMGMELQVETRQVMVMEVCQDTVTKEATILEDEISLYEVKFSN